MKVRTAWAVLVIALGAKVVLGAAEVAPTPGAAILQDLKKFREMGSVLYVAAHPDDENTQLITYLARGRHCRTAYLSLTRGDGGQNVLGPEFGETLGWIRTQELLSARRLDGGQQFFTRAMDFGFSKDVKETLKVWDRQQVVGDIVRVMRTFRPDVVVTRFSPEPSGTHGHHTASAVLAVEAFKLAGDPKAYPEQLEQLTVWQPKRILMNGRGGGNLQIDVSGSDPVTNESFVKIAGRSRAMHKSQGFGNFGGGGDRGARAESFQLLDGEPAAKDILEGVDTTWGRVPGGAEVGKRVEEIVGAFKADDPAASVPALLELRGRVAALGADPVVAEKRRDLDRVIEACVGLSVQTIVKQAEVVPGEPVQMRHVATVSSAVPVKWVGVRYPGLSADIGGEAMELKRGEEAVREGTQTLAVGTPVSQPYWLREEPSAGMYKVADASLIGRPENPPAIRVEDVFEIGGQTIVVNDEPVQVLDNGVRRRAEVIPPVSMKVGSEVELLAPKASKPVTVEVTAARANASGSIRLDVPAGWSVAPASQPFSTGAAGSKQMVTFTLTAPAGPVVGSVAVRAEVNGATYESGRVEVRYPHIPPLLLQPPVRVRAVCLDMVTRGHKVGYLPGAGDSVGQCIGQMGYEVTSLTGADLTPEKLAGFDAVVVGVRAFNVRTDVADRMQGLFDYVKGGGTVIVQYNRPGGDLKTDKLAPYDLRLSQQRVTDEHAPVTFLAGDHPALNVPNKITQADFEGWVQERGSYFPSDWDQEHFTPIVASADEGEQPLKGGLLVAPYGKGYYVYTGLSWFRQLPAGVPGAYRLFANLLALGK